MQQEIWKDIPGFVGMYQVSNCGRIKGLSRYNGKYHSKERILKLRKHKNGYLTVVLCKDGKSKSFRVHRIVALMFVPNPLQLPIINHKNEIKSDNRPDNLEWCTQQHNINYGNRNKKVSCKLSKTIIKIDLDDNETVYSSIKQAVKETGINIYNISSCLHGKRKTAGGFIWKYVN